VDRDRELEVRVSAVEQALAELQARFHALERGELSLAPPAAAPPRQEAWTPTAVATAIDFVGTLTLIGRTFVILAGGYLLRALTEAGTFGVAAGVLLGMIYALAWTIAADRVAPRHALSASFYGACSVLMGVPLVWEATTRFALMTPFQSALALTAMTAVVLVTAWHRQLHALAWLATVGGCLLASLLFVFTRTPLPYTMFLIALGIATLWLGYDREWTLLRWFAALFADLAVALLVGRALARPPLDPPSSVIAVQWFLVSGYLGSIGIRTLVRGRRVIPFEVVQTASMLLAGFAGALLVARRTGAGAFLLGPGVLALSLACYAVAFVDRRQARGINFYFFTSLALVFALTGCEFVLDDTPLAALYVSLTVLAAWAASRSHRTTLAAHALVYLCAAALPSGLAASAVAGLLFPATDPWAPVGAAAWLTLTAAALCWTLSTPEARRESGRTAHALRVALAVFAAAGVAGAGLVVARSMLPLTPPAESQAALIATVRTAVLAAAALVVAWLGRYDDTREFGTLLYPVLVCGALNLLAEDLPASPPLLLFIAFALYGGALIAGPRIARARPTSPARAAVAQRQPAPSCAEPASQPHPQSSKMP
jgi:hypothetical protein